VREWKVESGTQVEGGGQSSNPETAAEGNRLEEGGFEEVEKTKGDSLRAGSFVQVE
jgi:hypothetical protein